MDEFSQQVSDALFTHFPEFRQFAKEAEANDGTSFLTVSIPPPVEADVPRDLYIETSAQQVALTFDCYETHFYTLSDSGPYAHSALTKFLEKVVGETTAVISWWFDHQWCGASQFDVAVGVDKWIEQRIIPFNRKRIRSWKGSFNADVVA